MAAPKRTPRKCSFVNHVGSWSLNRKKNKMSKIETAIWSVVVAVALMTSATAIGQVIPAPAIIDAPPITILALHDFPTPEINEVGLPTGNYTTSSIVIVRWTYFYSDVGWDFMYRDQDDPYWFKPGLVSSGRDTNGVALRAAFLPFIEGFETNYTFLPLVTLNPKTK